VKKILLLVLLFSTAWLQTSESDDASSFLEITSSESPSVPNQIRTIAHRISEGAVYCGTGGAFLSASLLARIGWGICQISPWASTLGNEFLLLSDACGTAAKFILAQIFKERPLSQHSWQLNKKLLSQIPASSHEEIQLLDFLQRRWLAKSTGFYPLVINWICPCFGIDVQVHPETTSSYARNPGNKFSQTYINRVEAWKQSLPHPENFPLILTRNSDLQDYLPSCLTIAQNEAIQTIVDKASYELQSADSKVIVDLTHLLPDNDREKWLQTWEAYRGPFAKRCKERNVKLDQVLCIQRLQQNDVGGIRMLPLAGPSEEHHRFLLEWISNFGLSSNRVDLDRWPLPSATSKRDAPVYLLEQPSKEEFFTYLNAFEENWKSSHPQKTLMVKGTVQALKGLLSSLTDDKWNAILKSPTRSSVAQLSFLKIKDQLKCLREEADGTLFFETASRLEQVHADLSSLLEIFSPFTAQDFPAIYQNLLTSIPENLKPLTSCGIHSSGMTSLAGIFKAVERTLGKPPSVLYGENTYFENINAAEMVSVATLIDEATDKDWTEVDLILGQFNPVLKRVEFHVDKYRVETIAESIRKALKVREKPLTVAIDCTFDFIDSPRVGALLNEFEEEIEKGILNIYCYRSGLKFDLFGMDNYSGAPFYMIHNRDPKWASFDALLTEPVLQTDRLSLNWFCLAYKYAAPQLDAYRKQIFDNTWALLNKIPSRLLTDQDLAYRVVPVVQGADPCFIDIKVSGPLHKIRGCLLVGGTLTLKALEGGHPLFSRPSLGFYHPNLSIIFSEERTTIRLTLGLDPAQVDLLAACFKRIAALNGSHKSH
jgi:hypothetical protein